MSTGGFEKCQHTPGNLEGHTYGEGCVHAQGCVHTQRRHEKALNSHLWLTLRLCNKQEVKAIRELSTAWLSVELCLNTHPEPLSKDLLILDILSH